MKNNDDLTRDILKRRDEQNARKRKIFTVSACSVCAAAAVFAGGAALAAGNGFGINVDLTSNTGDSSSYELQPGVTELYEDKADGYTVKLLKDSDGNATSILAIDGKGRTAEIELNLENCGLPSPNASGNYVKVKTFKLKDENEYVVMAYMAPSEQVEGAAANALFFSLNEKSFETGKMEVYKADGETPYYAYAMNDKDDFPHNTELYTPYYAYAMNDGCANLGNTLFIPFGGGYCLTFDPDTLSVTHSELTAVEENSAVIDAPEVGLSDVHVWIAKGERPLEDGIIGDVTVILASDGTGRTAITPVPYDDYDYDTVDLLCLDKSKGEFLILIKDQVNVNLGLGFPYATRFYALNENTFETGEIKPYVLKDAPEDYPAPWVTDDFEVTEQAYTCRDRYPNPETFYVFDPETMTYTEKEDQPELPQNWTFTTDKIDGYYAQFTASGIAYDEESGDIIADRYEITIYAPDDRTLKIDCGEIPLIQDENGGFVLLFQMFKLEQTEGEYLLVFEPPALWSLPRCNALFYAVNEKAFETGKAELYQRSDESDGDGDLLDDDCAMIPGSNTMYGLQGIYTEGEYTLTFDPEKLTYECRPAVFNGGDEHHEDEHNEDDHHNDDHHD